MRLCSTYIIEDVLVGRVKEEDEGDDCVSGSGTAMDRVLRGTDGLADEKDDHAAARDKKQYPSPSNVDEE